MGPHNRVHVWVGGIMARGESPIDPIFFLHHANIDRLWAQWQNSHPGQHPNLSSSPWGLEMRPFTGWTEPQTRDTATMGYDYV
jgi:tyrosinase